jgi:hypothetical protein
LKFYTAPQMVSRTAPHRTASPPPPQQQQQQQQ